MSAVAPSWRVAVRLEDIPAAGRRFDLDADAVTRAGLAAAAGLRALPRLNATFAVTRHGRDGLRVTGVVSATVEQTCVVTLEPVIGEIEESLDLTFVPSDRRDHSGPTGEGRETTNGGEEAPEALVNGIVDLGAIATEFFVLGIDPYPRKPGAKFAAPVADEPVGHPFAALAALKKPDRRG